MKKEYFNPEAWPEIRKHLDCDEETFLLLDDVDIDDSGMTLREKFEFIEYFECTTGIPFLEIGDRLNNHMLPDIHDDLDLVLEIVDDLRQAVFDSPYVWKEPSFNELIRNGVSLFWTDRRTFNLTLLMQRDKWSLNQTKPAPFGVHHEGSTGDFASILYLEKLFVWRWGEATKGLFS